MNRKSALLGMTACLSGFTAISILMVMGKTISFDRVVAAAVQSDQAIWLEQGAKWLGTVASPKMLLLLAVLLMCGGVLRNMLAAKKEPAITLALLLFGFVNIAAAVANQLLKHLFQRPRPLPNLDSYSFPSGHSMMAFAFAMTAAYLLWRSAKSGLGRNAALAAALLFTLLSGVSRIYLNMHYPSDVVAGFCVSGAILLAALLGYEQLRQRFVR